MIKGVSIANLGRGGEGVATHGWEGWAPGVHEGHGNMTGARQRNENDMKGHELGTTIMRDDHGREHRDWDEEERGGGENDKAHELGTTGRARMRMRASCATTCTFIFHLISGAHQHTCIAYPCASGNDGLAFMYVRSSGAHVWRQNQPCHKHARIEELVARTLRISPPPRSNGRAPAAHEKHRAVASSHVDRVATVGRTGGGTADGTVDASRIAVDALPAEVPRHADGPLHVVRQLALLQGRRLVWLLPPPRPQHRPVPTPLASDDQRLVCRHGRVALPADVAAAASAAATAISAVASTADRTSRPPSHASRVRALAQMPRHSLGSLRQLHGEQVLQGRAPVRLLP